MAVTEGLLLGVDDGVALPLGVGERVPLCVLLGDGVPVAGGAPVAEALDKNEALSVGELGALLFVTACVARSIAPKQTCGGPSKLHFATFSRHGCTALHARAAC